MGFCFQRGAGNVHSIFPASDEARYGDIDGTAGGRRLIDLLGDFPEILGRNRELLPCDFTICDSDFVIRLYIGDAHSHIDASNTYSALRQIHSAIRRLCAGDICILLRLQRRTGDRRGDAGRSRIRLRAIPAGIIFLCRFVGSSCRAGFLRIAGRSKLLCRFISSSKTVQGFLADFASAVRIAIVFIGISEGCTDIVDIDIGANPSKACIRRNALCIDCAGFVGLHFDILRSEAAAGYGRCRAGPNVIDSHAHTGGHETSAARPICAFQLRIILGLDGSICTCRDVGIRNRSAYRIFQIVHRNGRAHTGTEANGQAGTDGFRREVLRISCIHRSSLGSFQCGIIERCHGLAFIAHRDDARCSRDSCGTGFYVVASGENACLLCCICTDVRRIGFRIDVIHSCGRLAGESIHRHGARCAYAHIATADAAILLDSRNIRCLGRTHGKILGIDLLLRRSAFYEGRCITAEGIRIHCRTGIHTGQRTAADTKGADNAAYQCFIMRKDCHITDIGLVFIDICIYDFGFRGTGNLIRRNRRIHADADFGRRPDACGDGYILQCLLAVCCDDEAFLFFLSRREFSFFFCCRRFGVFRHVYGFALSGCRYVRTGNSSAGITGNGIHSHRRTGADRSHTGRGREIEAAAVILQRARILSRYDHVIICVHRCIDHIGGNVIRQLIDCHIGFGIHRYRRAACDAQADTHIEDIARALGFDGRIFHFLRAAFHRSRCIACQGH